MKSASDCAFSALQSFAALDLAALFSAASSLALLETHLPKAFLSFLFLPYVVLKFALPAAVRSALHSFEAFCLSVLVGWSSATAVKGTASATTRAMLPVIRFR